MGFVAGPNNGQQSTQKQEIENAPRPRLYARPETQTAGNCLTAPFVIGPWGYVLGNIAGGYNIENRQ